jgi:hypothetical protein
MPHVKFEVPRSMFEVPRSMFEVTHVMFEVSHVCHDNYLTIFRILAGISSKNGFFYSLTSKGYVENFKDFAWNIREGVGLVAACF